MTNDREKETLVVSSGDRGGATWLIAGLLIAALILFGILYVTGVIGGGQTSPAGAGGGSVDSTVDEAPPPAEGDDTIELNINTPDAAPADEPAPAE